LHADSRARQALVVLALAGCGGGRASAPAEPGLIANAATADAGGAPEPDAQVDLLARATPIFSTLAGARVLKGPVRVGTEAVYGMWCVVGPPRPIAQALEADLTALGWQDVVVQFQGQRVIITGSSGDLFFAGGVQEQPRWAECDGAKGMSYVVLNVRRNPRR
jgi:hypothetical protein